MKGASVPVRVFELKGPGRIRSRLESSRARGFSRFVGREQELALLEGALDDARVGRPKVVLITAEPGAGKSRLCHELVERAGGVALHHVRALSHGRMLPFHVIVALARSLFGLGEVAPPSDVRDAVRRGLGSARPDPIALEFWLELLGASDHVPAPSGLEPEARRTRLFRSLVDLMQARARRELTLLWVEDLHWLDPASEAALEMLTERLLAPESAGSRALLLATTRPEYRPAWPTRVERLSLGPLAVPDSRTLLDDWLGSDDALTPLRARIEARARGNPLFVEEMIRSLVERGVLRGARGAYAPAAPIEEIALPETVQAVLASRIDRLSDRDKDVLQAAAVVGRDVPVELLRAVVDLPAPELAASLERLSTAELLGPAGTPGEHAFRHPLAQEVAYRTQLADRRRGTHAAIARALLAIHGSAAAPHAALLAHHFDEAGERPEAARWHEQAGRRVARSDPADGARHCRRVTTLLAAVPESRETLTLELTSRIALLEIGRIAGIEEREARDLFGEARAVAERLQDTAGHAFLLTSYGRLRGLAGDVGQYLACAERATELAEESDDAVFEFEMRSVLAHAELAVGRLAPARATAERALAAVARIAGLREAVERSTAPVCAACGGRWRARTSGVRRRPRPPWKRSSPRRARPRSTSSTGRTPSCARSGACGAICPARSPRAAAPSSSRKSAGARSLGWRPRRFSAPRSSRTATSTRPRAGSSGPSPSLACGAPRYGTSRASSRRSRTRSGPPAPARKPARLSRRRASSSIKGGAGGSAPSTSRWRGCASWPRSLPPTAARSRARSSPWTPSRPSWTPITTDASRRSSASARHVTLRARRTPRPVYLLQSDPSASPGPTGSAREEDAMRFMFTIYHDETVLDAMPESELQALVDGAHRLQQRAQAERPLRRVGRATAPSDRPDHPGPRWPGLNDRRPLRRDEGAARRILPHRGEGHG